MPSKAKSLENENVSDPKPQNPLENINNGKWNCRCNSAVSTSPRRTHPKGDMGFPLLLVDHWALITDLALDAFVVVSNQIRDFQENDCLKQCMALIKKGESVFIFPEGTRSKDGKLGPFEKGAFSMAAKTGVPIVPISLIGTGEIMPPGFEGRLNPGSMKLIVHQPIIGKNPDALCMQGS